jgi:hypothetical protein
VSHELNDSMTTVGLTGPQLNESVTILKYEYAIRLRNST